MHVIDEASPLFPFRNSLFADPGAGDLESAMPRDSQALPSESCREENFSRLSARIIGGESGNGLGITVDTSNLCDVDLVVMLTCEDVTQRETLRASHSYRTADFVGGNAQVRV